MELTKENYYTKEADMAYMSVSQLKNFMFCEAKALAELRNETEKEDRSAFLEGHYLHAWNEGKLKGFQEDNLEIYKYSNPAKGKKEAFLTIDKTIESLEKDENIMEIIQGQKEVIMTANLFDIDWKFQMDIYNPGKGRIVDLKFMNDINKKFWDNSTRGYINFVKQYKYHYQMVLYAILEQQATQRDEYLEPYIVAISKETPPRKVILNGFLEDISEVLSDVAARLPRIIKVKNGETEPFYCGECEYCRSILKARTINYKKLLTQDIFE
jgi:hypothetical protein